MYTSVSEWVFASVYRVAHQLVLAVGKAAVALVDAVALVGPAPADGGLARRGAQPALWRAALLPALH